MNNPFCALGVESVMVLSSDDMRSLWSQVSPWYRFPPGEVLRGTRLLERPVDDLLPPALVRLLKALPIEFSEKVHAVLNGKVGAAIVWEELLNQFDEVWYPGRDDLLVFAFESQVMVYLTHEERLVASRMD